MVNRSQSLQLAIFLMGSTIVVWDSNINNVFCLLDFKQVKQTLHVISETN